MRRFVLERKEDVSGVSGTGTVAEGVEFSDGKVALRWVTNHDHQSTVIWDSIKSVDVIHGHDGRTTVRWLDQPAVETAYAPSSSVQPTVHTPRPGQCRNPVANGIVAERAHDLPHWLGRKDRTVHGYGTDSKGERYEIVRYDIQSRFFQEWAYRRRTVSLAEAVALTEHAHLGRPGGGAFDRKVMERMGL